MEIIIGYIAAFLTTISFIPQAIKAIQKGAKDISLSMYIIFTIGVSFWIAYGFILNSLPMIISNIITLALALIILTIKIKALRNK